MTTKRNPLPESIKFRIKVVDEALFNLSIECLKATRKLNMPAAVIALALPSRYSHAGFTTVSQKASKISESLWEFDLKVKVDDHARVLRITASDRNDNPGLSSGEPLTLQLALYEQLTLFCDTPTPESRGIEFLQ